MPNPKPARRQRRQFTDEFKAGAIRLVLDEGKTVGAVARELDLTASALADWVRKAQADRTQGRTGLTGVEREELARLRKEVPELRMEREVLTNSSHVATELVEIAPHAYAVERPEPSIVSHKVRQPER
jgi:transposase